MKVAQSCLTLRPSPWNSPGQNTGVGKLFPSPGDLLNFLLQGNLPNPGIELRSPVLQADSLPAEPPVKPKNTGVGTLSFLQRIPQPRNRPRNQTGVSCIAGEFFTS